MKMQYIYAHRGASGYAPENTLRAFELACDMHADGVELDVQLTRDRKLVVIHDETIDRVTDGTGHVAEYTLAELSQYPVTMHKTGVSEPIPLLSDVLALLKERGLKLNIELKNSCNFYPGMEEMCLMQVADAGMTENVLYSSFNHYSLLHLKEIAPQVRCGLLYDATLVKPWKYAAELGMDALHPHFTELFITGEVEEAHKRRLEVNPWTVNREEDLRRIIATGADRIITNYPDRARALLG